VTTAAIAPELTAESAGIVWRNRWRTRNSGPVFDLTELNWTCRISCLTMGRYLITLLFQAEVLRNAYRKCVPYNGIMLT